MADTLCFLQALKERRSYYALSDKSPAEQAEIIQVIKEAVKYAPSAFNCQGTRAVVLFGERHLKVWQIVCETLQARVPADKFAPTAQKIASFSAAYGTVLFWEDWTAARPTAVVSFFSCLSSVPSSRAVSTRWTIRSG